jgi:hypothetical protein
VRVRGPLSGAILGYELGLTRYEALPEVSGQHHVELIGMGEEHDVTAQDLEGEMYALPEKVTPAEAKRSDARRVWNEHGVLELEGGSQFPPSEGFEYWHDIERVLFPAVAAAALAGEDFE